MTKFEKELLTLKKETNIKHLKFNYNFTLRIAKDAVRAQVIPYFHEGWDCPELRKALLYQGLEYSKLCTVVSHTKDLKPKAIMGYALIRPDFN